MENLWSYLDKNEIRTTMVRSSLRINQTGHDDVSRRLVGRTEDREEEGQVRDVVTISLERFRV